MQKYEPVWFRPEKDKLFGRTGYKYTNRYWQCKEEQDWSQCPDIF